MSVRMTQEALEKRRAQFLHGGVPRWMRVYDNGGETTDRYTVVFTGRYTHRTLGQHWSMSMSGAPFWPQGVCLHNEYPFQVDSVKHVSGRRIHCWPPAIGRKCYLGVRIRFQDLPKDCQKAAMDAYEYLWDLTTQIHPSSADLEPPVVIVPSRKRKTA